MFTFIIINYNQKELITECIKSIHENITSFPFEIIVVNNSPEEDLTYLTENFSGLNLITNKNLGFAQANNLAVKHAKYDFLVFLNADTKIKTDFTKGFIEKFGASEFGAVGLKLYNQDNTFQLSFWKENTFFNEIENKKLEKIFTDKKTADVLNIEKEYSEIKEVDWITGASMVMKKDIFTKTGGFDERFFLFYEDADICKRLQENGYKTYFYPHCKIIHYKGENINKEFEDKTYYYAKKSQLLYYNLHNGITDRVFLRSYLFIRFLLRTIFRPCSINYRIFKLVCGIRND